MYRPGQSRQTLESIESRYRLGLGGNLQEQWGVGGGPAAGGDRGEGLGKGRWGEPGGKWFGGNGKVPLKVPLRAGPNLRLISSTPLEPPFVLSSDILKIRTLVQGANSYFIFFDIY